MYKLSVTCITGEPYYIYDSYGNLCVILPSLTADVMAISGVWMPATDGSDVLSRYAYLYNYDIYNHCIRKMLPDAGWIRYEYDYSDRLTVSQDAEQVSNSPALCTFYLYDDDNRPIVQGLCEFTRFIAVLGYSTMLTSFKRSSDGSIIAGGLDGSGYNGNLSLISPVVHTVNYYDDYGFRSLTGFNNSNFPVASYPDNGLLPGTVTSLLDGSG